MSRREDGVGAVAGGTGIPAEIVIDGTLYDRVGIDDDSRAIYAAESGVGVYVAEMEPGSQAKKKVHVPDSRFRDLLDRIAEDVGWREKDRAWFDRADRYADGGVEA